MQKKCFYLEKKSSVFSLKRDHGYYQAQQQIQTTGSDYLDFVVVALKVKLIYMTDGLCHDVIHDYIEE